MHDAYSRTEKESHLDTIHYELSMLNFCGKELDGLSAARQRAHFNAFLECFLLHYRNTMEFLSGAHHRTAKRTGETSDLSTFDPKPWAGRELSPEELAESKPRQRRSMTSISKTSLGIFSTARNADLTEASSGTTARCSKNCNRRSRHFCSGSPFPLNLAPTCRL